MFILRKNVSITILLDKVKPVLLELKMQPHIYIVKFLPTRKQWRS